MLCSANRILSISSSWLSLQCNRMLAAIGGGGDGAAANGIEAFLVHNTAVRSADTRSSAWSTATYTTGAGPGLGCGRQIQRSHCTGVLPPSNIIIRREVCRLGHVCQRLLAPRALWCHSNNSSTRNRSVEYPVWYRRCCSVSERFFLSASASKVL
jgi:hypothetical protein